MKKIILGIVIGATLTSCATAFAADVKNYVLTLVNYPILVNGVEFKDAENPILNYNGSTYVPLAKLSDITGVKYKWNDTAKRIEITTDSVNIMMIDGSGELINVKNKLADDAAIEAITKGEGETVQVQDPMNTPKPYWTEMPK